MALVRHRERYRSLLLLVTLLLLIMLSPFLAVWHVGEIIGNLLLTSIIAASLYSAWDTHKPLPRWVLLLTVLVLALNWLSAWLLDGWQAMRLFINLIFFVKVTLRLIHQIARATDVSANTIYTAISGYILLGFTGSLLATSIEVIQPNSFVVNIDPLPQEGSFQSMLYFSFVTLTTIGYGDITPFSPLARSFTVLLGLTGQIYLTIIVALLVGKFLNGQSQG